MNREVEKVKVKRNVMLCKAGSHKYKGSIVYLLVGGLLKWNIEWRPHELVHNDIRPMANMMCCDVVVMVTRRLIWM